VIRQEFKDMNKSNWGETFRKVKKTGATKNPSSNESSGTATF